MECETQATTLALQRDGGLSRNHPQIHVPRQPVFKREGQRQHTQNKRLTWLGLFGSSKLG